MKGSDLHLARCREDGQCTIAKTAYLLSSELSKG